MRSSYSVNVYLFDHIHVRKSKANTRSNPTSPKTIKLFKQLNFLNMKRSYTSDDDDQIKRFGKSSNVAADSDSESDRKAYFNF